MLPESEQSAQAGRSSRPLPHALPCESSCLKLRAAEAPESLVASFAPSASPSLKVDDDLGFWSQRIALTINFDTGEIAGIVLEQEK